MAKKNCSKCGKEIGWLSQNKIDGELYCEDCCKQVKEEKKEGAKGTKKEERKAAKKKVKGRKPNDKRTGESGPNVQKFVLIATACILGLILLFPPFYCIHEGKEVSRGNFFVFSPPNLSTKNGEFGFVARIDAFALLVQYLYVVTMGGLLWLALQIKGSHQPDQSLPQESTNKIEQPDESDTPPA